MKRNLRRALASLTLVAALGGCGRTSESNVSASGYVPVREIDLEDTSVTLSVGETKKIGVTVYPVTASDTSVSYVSADPSIVTVSKDGVLTGVSRGTTSIILASGSIVNQLKVTVVTPETKKGIESRSGTVSLDADFDLSGLLSNGQSGSLDLTKQLTDFGKLSFSSPLTYTYRTIQEGNYAPVFDSEENPEVSLVVPFVNGSDTQTVTATQQRNNLLALYGLLSLPELANTAFDLNGKSTMALPGALKAMQKGLTANVNKAFQLSDALLPPSESKIAERLVGMKESLSFYSDGKKAGFGEYTGDASSAKARAYFSSGSSSIYSGLSLNDLLSLSSSLSLTDLYRTDWISFVNNLLADSEGLVPEDSVYRPLLAGIDVLLALAVEYGQVSKETKTVDGKDHVVFSLFVRPDGIDALNGILSSRLGRDDVQVKDSRLSLDFFRNAKGYTGLSAASSSLSLSLGGKDSSVRFHLDLDDETKTIENYDPFTTFKSQHAAFQKAAKEFDSFYSTYGDYLPYAPGEPYKQNIDVGTGTETFLNQMKAGYEKLSDDAKFMAAFSGNPSEDARVAYQAGRKALDSAVSALKANGDWSLAGIKKALSGVDAYAGWPSALGAEDGGSELLKSLKSHQKEALTSLSDSLKEEHTKASAFDGKTTDEELSSFQTDAQALQASMAGFYPTKEEESLKDALGSTDALPDALAAVVSKLGGNYKVTVVKPAQFGHSFFADPADWTDAEALAFGGNEDVVSQEDLADDITRSEAWRLLLSLNATEDFETFLISSLESKKYLVLYTSLGKQEEGNLSVLQSACNQVLLSSYQEKSNAYLKEKRIEAYGLVTALKNASTDEEKTKAKEDFEAAKTSLTKLESELSEAETLLFGKNLHSPTMFDDLIADGDALTA